MAASRGKSKSGNSVLKHKIALCAGLVAALAVSGHALAQPAPPPAYPGAGYPIAGLPPHEIVTIVRSTGLEPLGSPVRQGPAYALRAVDPAGEEVRVIVDAQRGRIVKVIPLMAPRYAMPLMRPPYGRPPRPIAMVPEGYGPYPPVMAPPPGAEGVAPNAGPGNTPGASAAADPATPTPLPRPRPKLAASDTSDGKPATGAASNEHETTGTANAPRTPAATSLEE
jgi:hypothetical protein